MTPITTPPAEMTDEQLTDSVAVEVMRWTKREDDRYAKWLRPDGREVEEWEFCPTSYWNHTMEVVRAVLDTEGQQEWWMLQQWCEVHRAQFGERSDYVEDRNPQRAILLAALQAVRSSPSA